MDKMISSDPPLAPQALRAAIRLALAAPRRPALRLGGSLMALGLTVSSLPAAAAPAEFELSSLDGTNGFVLNGIGTSDYSGFSVSDAGDVNGDGVDDFIIGAPYAQQNDQSGPYDAGESYVVFGNSTLGTGGSIDLSALNGSNGFVLHGIDPYDRSGSSVSGAGDINGDGIDDLIIGAYYADPISVYETHGQAYVVFGDEMLGSGGSLDLSALDGTNGFTLTGIDDPSSTYDRDQLGRSVSGAGDVNGDGWDDLIVGAPGEQVAAPYGGTYYGAGESYVIFGSDSVGGSGSVDLAALDGDDGFAIRGFEAFAYSGRSVAGAGDVNGDGFADVIIGAPRSPDEEYNQLVGNSYVVFGGDEAGAGGSIELSALDGTDGFVLRGIDAYDYAGLSVSGAGDINGDGNDDLIIGAPKAEQNGPPYDTGEGYVVFGDDMLGSAGSLDLSSLDGGNGFVLTGIADNQSFLTNPSGISVSGAGDINDDGFDDIIVGIPGGDPATTYSRTDAGETYVVFGSSSVGTGGSLDVADLNGSNGFVLNGVDIQDASGVSVSNAGDLNDDGIADLIVGALRASSTYDRREGATYVVFGQAGDIDDDGVADNVDNCPTVPNVDQADSESDGVGNACDNCTLVENATQCDTNGDGFGNHCDADLNDDGGVTHADLGIFRGQYNTTGSDLDADLNCDGGVTSQDLGMFRMLFNRPPGPSGVVVGSSPPSIDNFHISQIYSSGTTVGWTTDILATSQVKYRLLSSSDYIITDIDPALTTTHFVQVTGLDANTDYGLIARSTSGGGPVIESSEISVRTRR